MEEERRLGQGLGGVTLHLDIDAHGRVMPRTEEVRRALADRAGRFTLLPSVGDLLLALRAPPAGGPVPSPRCILAGDLSAFPIADFVAFVHQSKLSGILTVASGAVERSVAFKDGEVHSASSEAPGERIGEVAVRLGHLDEAQLAEAAAGGRPIGKVLVEMGLLTPKDLWKCFHEQVTAVFHAILMARDGTFRLMDDPGTDRPIVPLAVNTQSLLMDGIRRIDEMRLFRDRIPGSQVFLRRREPKRPVTLRPAEEAVLAQVDGQRRVADVARAIHLSEFDATKILYHLAEAGYVEAAAEPAAVAGDPMARLDTIAGGFNELLLEVTSAAAARGDPESFLAGVRSFLADPASRYAALWLRAAVAADGAVDRAALLGSLATLGGAALQKLEPSGDPGRFLFDALRELMFFYLFQAGERLPRDEDDALARSVKQKLAKLEALR